MLCPMLLSKCRRVLLIVCLVRPNTVAASVDVSPAVTGGIRCFRVGDLGGKVLIMVTVLCPMVFMM